MSTFQPPPTWALPVLVNEQTKIAQFNPIWLKWFVDLAQVLTSIGGSSGTVDHNTTVGKQGGGSSEFYHVTQALYNALIAGFTGTGKLVRETGATLVTPTLGAATGTSLNAAVIGAVTPAAGTFTTIKVTAVAGYQSSDGSSGFTGTVTTASLVGKTLTIKDGIITGFA